MNKERRKAIADIQERLTAIIGDIEALRDEEQEYFDNMPEAIQGGERGDNAQSAIDALSAAYDAAEEADAQLSNAMEN